MGGGDGSGDGTGSGSVPPEVEVATAAVAVSAATMRGCPRDEADEAEIEAENRLSIGGEDAAASGLYIPLDI
ncbi:hypothetical protein [Oryza sativa Japonica Group]|uniref:Uncharacterized protein n=1 Tax=Oryza sativa subsp. japonica TaxID=39947 RepID=Q5QMR7_ORYSJ|nr:hypothetical protein [Oryza sativa Japonica Group]